MPISVLVWVRSFIEPDVLMYCSTVPLRFRLSDPSALEMEIRVRIRVRLTVALF